MSVDRQSDVGKPPLGDTDQKSNSTASSNLLNESVLRSVDRTRVERLMGHIRASLE